ncbi:MAG: RICIN domain-containing protein, partial [Bacteroidota bacterium]
TNLQQGNNSNASHQQWEIEAGPTGYYFIKNLNSNNYIDVAAYSQADGGNIHIWGKHGGNNQQWEFLPVSSAKIVSLNAKNRPASVNLRWELNEYSPNTRFEVEKSIDGIIFGRIAEITTAKHGIQDVSFSYGDAEIENMENETIIYRIKMTNLTSGKTSHSSEITVKLESKRGLYLKAYPNPMRDYFTLEYSSAGESKPEIIIYAKLGQVVHRQKLDSFEGRLRISTTDWAKGMYYLRLKNASTEELLKLSKSE